MQMWPHPQRTAVPRTGGAWSAPMLGVLGRWGRQARWQVFPIKSGLQERGSAGQGREHGGAFHFSAGQTEYNEAGVKEAFCVFFFLFLGELGHTNRRQVHLRHELVGPVFRE